MKILISMQNKMYADYIAYNLRRYEHSVSVVSDGLNAINLLKSEKWDSFVTGITLEYFNGMEVIEQFREHQLSVSKTKEYYDPNIVIITRIRNEKNIRSAMSMGVRKYLLVPVSTSVLINKIIFKDNELR